ncbi:MAG TPA: hypothetical protein VN776_16260 [Terracidiphilus sp.]|nr:hypothetical protein [Terracidiphilus sp.]
MSTPMIFLFPIAIIVVTFAFTGVIHWVDSSRKEREAFYRAETLKRLAEAPGEGAKAAIDLMREDERVKCAKSREGMKVGGLVNVGVGVGLIIILHAMVRTNPAYLCGLIPGIIGVALLVYVYFMAPPLQ